MKTHLTKVFLVISSLLLMACSSVENVKKESVDVLEERAYFYSK